MDKEYQKYFMGKCLVFLKPPLLALNFIKKYSYTTYQHLKRKSNSLLEDCYSTQLSTWFVRYKKYNGIDFFVKLNGSYLLYIKSNI